MWDVQSWAGYRADGRARSRDGVGSVDLGSGGAVRESGRNLRQRCREAVGVAVDQVRQRSIQPPPDERVSQPGVFFADLALVIVAKEQIGELPRRGHGAPDVEAVTIEGLMERQRSRRQCPPVIA